MRAPVSRALTRSALRPRPLPRRAFASSVLRRHATAVEQRDPVEFDSISTLSNGVRVATEALPGPFSGLGVFLDAGSRYENDELRGVSHIIDRMAFKATTNRSSDEMLETLESLGGNIQCASSRETLMYQAASFNASVPTSLGLLAETIRQPLITEQEVAQQIETAEYEIREIWSKPELIFPELINVAAYKDNTLGNPLLCPQERLPYINKYTIERYRSAFFRPERIVVAFVGVPHDEALRLSEKYFGDMRAIEEPILAGTGLETSFTQSPSPSFSGTSTPSLTYSAPSATTSKLLNKIPFFKNLSTSAPSQASVSDLSSTSQPSPSSALNFSEPSRYTGGFLRLPTIPPPANPALPRLSHIHLAFEALPIASDDIYALAALQMLLGGGGSFSAGGPGKGMYSRLYTNVLNQHPWAESCAAFNLAYTDSGVFGIGAACHPAHLAAMLEVMCRELAALARPPGQAGSLREPEVARAKNQLKSSLLMNLESRMVELEDLGRQVQIHGRKVGAREMCARTDALTVADLREVARKVVRGLVRNPGQGTGKPTVVVQEGDVEGVTRRDLEWGEIQERIAKWQLGQ